MKNNIKKVILLSIFLIIISIIVINLMGKTYTMSFEINNFKDYKLIVEEETGKIEILDQKEKDGKYLIKVKAIKPGKVTLYIDYGEYQTGRRLYIFKNLVIAEENFFGKTTGSTIIPISILIILLYVLVLLIKNYKLSIKENIYQYKNIAYLGLIIFISFSVINNVLSFINYQGLYETVNRTINSLSFVSFFLLPLSFVTFILVTISNINLIRKEGKSLRNLLGLFLGIFICVLTVLPDFIYKKLMQLQIINIYNLNGPGPYIYNFFEALIYLTVAYLECVLIATIVVSIKSIKKKPQLNKDYMIILGCQIKKDGSLTPLLKGRVDRAIEFRNEQLKSNGKDLVFVPSGGKGKDEVISEAEAMKKYLLSQGIKEKNILIENKSKNTYENLKNSIKIINNKKANIGFSTTNYHVMRAGLTATEEGLILEGIGSKTKSYFWINSFIREFIGTLYSERKKHILFFSLITIIIMIMIVITYIGNNI